MANLDDIISIGVSESGLMSIQLPSGTTINLPDLVPLGVTPSSDDFHRYQTDSLVGYSAGNGNVGNVLDFPPSLGPTTYDNAFLALRHKPAPSFEDLQVGQVVNNGDVSHVALLGSVTHYVYPEHGLIINVTNPDHTLHPGIVVRYLHEQDGQFHIVTEGVGAGAFATANVLFDDVVWGAVDFDVQTLLNVFGEAEIPENFQECFGAGTPIDMWPHDKSLKPGPDGVCNQKAVSAKIWKKPIELIEVGDTVVSFDDNGNMVPGHVPRTFQNEVKILLNFFGTRVTPGHVYYRADSKKAHKFETLIDVLRDDGVIQKQDGTLIRAATNVPVGDPRDGFVKAITGTRRADGSIDQKEEGRIRLGTRFIVGDGEGRKHWAVADLIEHAGGVVGEDEMIRVGDGPPMAFHWEFGDTLPKPEDFVLEASGTTLEDIYKAAEWENQQPQMPAPMVMDGGPVQPLPHKALNAMPRNEPLSLSPTPAAKARQALNRKQRKAMEAKQRKAGKTKRMVS